MDLLLWGVALIQSMGMTATIATLPDNLNPNVNPAAVVAQGCSLYQNERATVIACPDGKVVHLHVSDFGTK